LVQDGNISAERMRATLTSTCAQGRRQRGSQHAHHTIAIASPCRQWMVLFFWPFPDSGLLPMQHLASGEVPIGLDGLTILKVLRSRKSI